MTVEVEFYSEGKTRLRWKPQQTKRPFSKELRGDKPWDKNYFVIWTQEKWGGAGLFVAHR
jgi:hypothetical protein